ncbi:transmembrane protein 119 [Ochotona curzoniae]|uniref:transmembrane protein 119 n=1 Tax=Ochotona curzoniae TaxID=130825 RepID=UPI001B348D5F|nr:transmembrane protein 119 [Ochotona curzoniae]
MICTATAPSFLVLSLLLLLLPSVPAAHSVFLEELGGSGEAEGSSASSPSLPPPRTPALSPTSLGPQATPLAGPSPPTSFLEGVMDFFRQYVLLVAVVGSLALLLLFVVCAALITRQQHKASAYYPSSFPKKKYVDQSDRAGGPRAFSEVPARAPDSRPEEALDSSRQLQADILAATQNLKSPARGTQGSREGARLAEGKLGGEEEGKEEEKGGKERKEEEQQVYPECQGCALPAENPQVEAEPSAVVAENTAVAAEDPEESEGSPPLAQDSPSV